MTSRDLKFRALLDAAQASREADRLAGKFDKVDASTRKTSTGLSVLQKGAGLLAVAFAGAQIGQFIVNTVQLAVTAEDAGDKFAAVFGPAVKDAQAFVDGFANKAGFATHEMQDMLATTANVAKGLGATGGEALTLAERLATMAGDVASFNGATKDTPQVLSAMQSALTGEREALKAYGIVITEADVQTEAFRMTGKTTAGSLTTLDKALASMELIAVRAGAAMGDLDRTSDSTSNQMAELSAAWKDAQVEIGQNLIPTLHSMIPVLKDLVGLTVGFAGAMEDFGSGGLLIRSVFDDGARAGRAFEGALEGVNSMIDAGESPLVAYASAMALIAIEGGPNAGAAVAALRDELGASTGAMQRAADTALEFADELGLTAEAQEFLREQGTKANEAANEQIATFDSGTAEAQRFANIGLGAATEAQEDLTEATDDTRTALQKLNDKQRESIDPLFNFTQKTRDLEDAVRDVDTARRDFGRGSPEHIEAMEDQALAYLDLRDAAETLRLQGLDPTKANFRALATQAGLTKEQIRLMEQQWDLWAPKTKAVTLTKAGDGWTGEVGGNPFMAHGGVVRARPGGRQVTVGEAGSDEAIVPLNSEGADVLADAFGGAGGGGGVTTTVVQLVVGSRMMEEIVVQGTAAARRKGRL